MRSDPSDDAGTNLLMSGVLGAFMLFLFVVGVLAFRGHEVDYNKLTGKLSLKRVG